MTETPTKAFSHGWYSKKMSNQSRGTSFYRTPDGGEIEVTNVNDSPTEPSTGWDDDTYVGEVTEWLRKGRGHESRLSAVCPVTPTQFGRGHTHAKTRH